MHYHYTTAGSFKGPWSRATGMYEKIMQEGERISYITVVRQPRTHFLSYYYFFVQPVVKVCLGLCGVSGTWKRFSHGVLVGSRTLTVTLPSCGCEAIIGFRYYYFLLYNLCTPYRFFPFTLCVCSVTILLLYSLVFLRLVLFVFPFVCWFSGVSFVILVFSMNYRLCCTVDLIFLGVFRLLM